MNPAGHITMFGMKLWHMPINGVHEIRVVGSRKKKAPHVKSGKQYNSAARK